jgi:hypothetical protein
MIGTTSKPIRVDLQQVKATVDGVLLARKLPERWLYERIGMSKNGYREMWYRNSVKATALQDIADAIGYTLGQLLGESPAGDTVSDPAGAYRRPFLEERVEDLERRLRALEKSKAQ